MTTTPAFDDLTPPQLMVDDWQFNTTNLPATTLAYRAGASYGWEQARQLWPEPITDRPPTEADGDDCGMVQFVNPCGWGLKRWDVVEDLAWLHTPRWQPRQPTLQEQALAALERSCATTPEDRELIRRALEQAGEGQP
jgi:hypothetical protein